MAEIINRVWRSGPRKVKRVGHGYTLQVDGKQVQKFNSAWTDDDAQKALAAAVLDRRVLKPPAPVSITFGQASERFLFEDEMVRLLEACRQSPESVPDHHRHHRAQHRHAERRDPRAHLGARRLLPRRAVTRAD